MHDMHAGNNHFEQNKRVGKLHSTCVPIYIKFLEGGLLIAMQSGI